MARRELLSLIFIVLLGTAASAQPSPNLTGKWKLNPSKSEFGAIPGPDSRTDDIVQNGSDIKQHVVSEGPQGKQDYTLSLTVDGKERDVPPDSPMSHIGEVTLRTIAASWKGSTLVVSEGLQFQGNDVQVENHYDLSSDSALLTVTSQITSAMGEVVRKLVFDRQDQTAAAQTANAAPPATPAAKQSQPNFTGTWKLDPAQCSFGSVPGPESRVDIIDHKDSVIKVSTVQKGTMQGDVDYSYSLTTDGKPSTMNFQGTDATNTAYWTQDMLEVDTDTTFQGTELTIKSLWSLSEDGKTLTVNTHFASSLGELDQKLVFVKQ